MSDEKKSDLLAEQMFADLRAFVSTLTPNEALCAGQRVAAWCNRMISHDDWSEIAAGVGPLLQLEFQALNVLFGASVGATVEHPNGAECGCYEAADFFVVVLRDRLIEVLQAAEEDQ